jgi:hypothetical protein
MMRKESMGETEEGWGEGRHDDDDEEEGWGAPVYATIIYQ